jgi:hypothetical protein
MSASTAISRELGGRVKLIEAIYRREAHPSWLEWQVLSQVTVGCRYFIEGRTRY